MTQRLTPSRNGLRGVRNVRLASGVFEVFVTMDQNLEYQQNLQDAAVAIIVLACRSNRFDDLSPLVPQLIEALRGGPAPGEVVRVGA